jgi:hypothetical protein
MPTCMFERKCVRTRHGIFHVERLYAGLMFVIEMEVLIELLA